MIANAVIALGFSLLLWYFFLNVGPLSSNRLLTWIGRYSLEIYVIHTVVQAAFRTLVSQIDWINPYASIAINIALRIALSMVFSLLSKRLGVHDLLFKPISASNRMKKGW